MPLAELRAYLLAADLEPYGPWLDFHEQFAGYELDLGNDLIVLGIGHDEPSWVPRPFNYDRERGSTFITCADGHPSYDY